MGVFEEDPASPTMHWQQYDRWGPMHDRFVSPPSVLDPEGSRCSYFSPHQHHHQHSSSNAYGASPSSYHQTPSWSYQPYPANSGADIKAGYEASPPSQRQHGSTPTSPRATSPNSSCSDNVKLESLDTTSASSPAAAPATSNNINNNNNTDEVVCAGCGDKIGDRFYLLAVDQRWHSACLKCCQCNALLESEGTCFAKEGKIYCKEDYHRIFTPVKSCARCQNVIASHELVMRAKEYVFHVACFTCVTCHGPFAKGDHFGMQDQHVYCELHYEQALQPKGPPTPVPKPMPATTPSTATTPVPLSTPTDAAHHHIYNLPPDVCTYNGGQKGRPRKRKTKDLEALTASLDIGDTSYIDGYGPGSTMGLNGQAQRTKRMRTSFKHHQLRTMKSYFSINHNPDAKDLKQLSQKTGLPKRVLQVWFQNARAKWRRMMLKQEGKGPEKAEESTSLADISPHSGDGLSQAYGSGMQPTPITTEEQSPHFFLDSSEQST